MRWTVSYGIFRTWFQPIAHFGEVVEQPFPREGIVSLHTQTKHDFTKELIPFWADEDQLALK